jgi:hypothetical protein
VTVLLNIHHTPWQFMLVMAFPEIQFHATDWNRILREPPANVRVLKAGEFMDHEYDVVIYDNVHTHKVWESNSRKSVFVFHCEKDLGVSLDREAVVKAFDACDHVVSVGTHKLWTLRDFARHPKARAIRHAAFPMEPSSPIRGLVGTSHNAMSSEQISVWNDIHAGFPSLVIGHANGSGPWPKSSPTGLPAYIAELSKIDVFVNVVSGDSFGMAPMEAMCLGIPIITGLSRDIPDQFIPGWNCIITHGRAHETPKDIRHWAKVLINDRGLRDSIGLEGRKAALEFFSLEQFQKNWRLIFEA